MGETQINDKGIHVDALTDLGKSNTVKQLNNESTEMEQTIDGFVNSTILVGDEWQGVKDKFAIYKVALGKRSKAATDLFNAINEAIKLLLDYLGEDTYLTYEMLDEMKAEKTKAEQLIVSLQNKMDMVRIIEVTDDDGFVIKKKEYVYNIFDRREFQNSINHYKNVIIPEIERLIAKIEGLPAKYKEAEGIINTAAASINSFNNTVNNINPSKTAVMV